jgi:hypothetical protein
MDVSMGDAWRAHGFPQSHYAIFVLVCQVLFWFSLEYNSVLLVYFLSEMSDASRRPRSAPNIQAIRAGGGVWAKFAAFADGARIASERFWR